MTEAAPQPRKPTCFIISPIGKEESDTRKAADQVLKHLIKKALGDDFQIKRGDEESNPGSITSQIVESILEADLVIADLSGFNPNVYYEVAIAHGYDRPTVHLQRKDETPAFDLKDMRLIQYNLQDPDDLEKSQKTLKAYADFAMKTPEKARTPLAGARRFVQIEASADPVAQSNAEVIDQLRSMRSEIRQALQVGSARTSPSVRMHDVRSLRKIVERAAGRNALETSDLDSVITKLTSESFDDWARKILTQITGETENIILNSRLFDEELRDGPQFEEDPDAG